MIRCNVLRCATHGGTLGPTLAAAHPGIARGWLTASSKLVNAHTVTPASRRLVWWRCADTKCGDVFQRSVADHCNANGACRRCRKRPTRTTKYAPLPANARYRRLTNRPQLWASAPNRVKRSVLDLASAKTLQAFVMKFGSAAQRRSAAQTPPPVGERNLQPMLAQVWEKSKQQLDDTESLTISPKLDGVRCVAAWDPAQSKVVLLSRHGTVLSSCPHVEDALTPLFRRDKWLVLDGELYHHTAFDSFEELSGLVRRDLACSDGDSDRIRHIQYHVFDVIDSRLQLAKGQQRLHRHLRCEPFSSSSFAERYRLLKILLKDSDSSTLRLVPAIKCRAADVPALMQQYLRSGYEGAMIRRSSHPYAPGRRTNSLMKYKPFQDSEYRISGVVEGTGKWRHSLAAFLCHTESGQLFHATPAVDDARRRHMWLDRRRLVGKMLTVQYQALTERGVPRFPVGKAIRGSSNRKDWL